MGSGLVLIRVAEINSILGSKRKFVLTSLSILVFALIGCSGNGAWMGTQSGTAASVSNGSSEVELARRSLFSPTSTVAKGSDSSYGLELIEREATSELEIAMPAGASVKPQITTLSSPYRIVVDLDGVNGPKSSTIDTPESLYVSRIRVGAHPDKSRIVLDMNESEGVTPTLLEHSDGKFTLKLEKANISGISTAVAAKETAVDSPNTEMAASIEKVESQELALNSVSNTDLLNAAGENNTPPSSEPQFSEPKAEAAELETASADITDIAKPNKENTRPIVYSYQLQSLSPSENTLIIEGDKLAQYTLKRSAPSEYVLRLPGATLAEGAQETMVAPSGSGAIRSVRSKAAGDVLEVRIFTSPEETLEVSASKDSLVVAASSQGFNSAESRAQAKPEIAKSDAKKAVAENEVSSTAADAIDTEITALLGEQPKYSGRLISLDLQDTDIDNALRIIAEVSNLNIIASEEVTGKITLRLVDVPWDQALDVILKTNGLDMIQENNVIRIAPVEKLRVERESLKQARQAEEELEPLGVRYVRISYAKAAELKPLVESVLSERGTVAYDDRTNQLIIKDIRSGVMNVAELIAKLDLRTPQVLLETQIVESTRNLSRDLGAEFGFSYVQSPATGNATGYNFPNSIAIGGSANGGSGGISSFPGDDSSAITFLLESADGTRSLSTRLTALETEGRVKVVSRPAVATTNNKQATIRSVEKIRVKAPDGGVSVATGAGSQASGTGTSATETIEIGIILEVTPQASPDYYVLLDINAKSSTLGSVIVDGIPSEIERSATSSVLVSSGQTFAMGGIYKTSDSNTIEGVPFLKDLPVIGHLFRRSLVKDQDEELLFFITPRIIEGSFDDAAMKAT